MTPKSATSHERHDDDVTQERHLRASPEPSDSGIFQMAEVAVPKELFQEILRLIAELRPQPTPAPA